MPTYIWILFLVALLVAAVGLILIRQRQRGGEIYASRSLSNSELNDD